MLQHCSATDRHFFILPGTFIFGLMLWSNFMPGTFIFGQMSRFMRIVSHFSGILWSNFMPFSHLFYAILAEFYGQI